MRFPLRFTSDFQLGVVARGMRARGQAPLVLKLSPHEETTAVVLPSVESAPRLVWIGGAEPLEHPEIARFANALANSGREVFLHTGGALVRRRMHEFQPSARFRFVFRFEGTSVAGNSMALQGIRGAKLSGFLTCALSVVGEQDDLSVLERRHAHLHQLDLDGYLIVPAANTLETTRLLSAARQRLLSRRWRRLSRMFSSVTATATVATRSVRRAARSGSGSISRINPEPGSRDCGEGAQA
jgi:hypothetical protein